MIAKKNKARAAAKSRVQRVELTRAKKAKKKPPVKTKIHRPSPRLEFVDPIDLREPRVCILELVELAEESDRLAWIEAEAKKWAGYSGNSLAQTKHALFGWLRFFSLKYDQYDYLKKLFPHEVA
jgi:hypothetical protein